MSVITAAGGALGGRFYSGVRELKKDLISALSIFLEDSKTYCFGSFICSSTEKQKDINIVNVLSLFTAEIPNVTDASDLRVTFISLYFAVC